MKKASEPFNFKRQADFDVVPISELVTKFDEEWYLDTSRQDTFDTHKETLSYFVCKADTNWKIGEGFVVDKACNNKELISLVEPIVSELESVYNGTRGNVLFIKLLAGKVIPEHADGGNYLDAARRIHIPIVTSANTIFEVGGEAINMGVGECWEINNARRHAVDNSGGEDRIHLLIDIMPNSKLPAMLFGN